MPHPRLILRLIIVALAVTTTYLQLGPEMAVVITLLFINIEMIGIGLTVTNRHIDHANEGIFLIIKERISKIKEENEG